MAEQSTSTGRRKNKALKKDDFARKSIAPNDGISKSSFFEAINTQEVSHGLGDIVDYRDQWLVILEKLGIMTCDNCYVPQVYQYL